MLDQDPEYYFPDPKSGKNVSLQSASVFYLLLINIKILTITAIATIAPIIAYISVVEIEYFFEIGFSVIVRFLVFPEFRVKLL